ncbi:sushi domain-containing protein 1 isoform X1 [Gopherus evgoodei]|uniref:Sushi domain containing 1 n=1 Tax=Gopherus evgoodei TaxID=1825980 RepID=A0A8C4VTG3_9SAUR|nr:sushi domain-containing protein 1 isoform X1 [Gopherus evgoodei]
MSPPGTAAGGGSSLAARRLLLLLVLQAARPAQGQRAATNSSVPDVCATCHANATCQQKEGKNVCICNYGFVGNGRTHCQDKDECQIGASKICGEHTSCHNTHGSFYCICLEGYHPSNNNKTFIPNDGTYCTDIDECQLSGLCGVGGRCVNTVGSYNCYCMEGYRPENGTEFFHPAGNTVSCKEIRCGPLEITHGHILGNYTSVLGSEVHYECEEGFYSEGENVSICTKDEIWEPSVISCKAVDCGVPPSVLNAYSDPVRRTTYGNEVAYNCLHGYVIESGNQTAVCNAKGQWEGADLVCKEIDCGRPLWIPQAEMIWDNSTTLGSMVYYKCSEGFHFNGEKNFSQCTIIQKWENITGVCEVTDCGRPPSIPNTDMIWNNISQLGSAVHYQCKKGFHSINRRNMSRCTYNGSWEIPDLICREVDCGIPPPIQHAELVWNSSSSLGSVVQYSCQRGFEYAGGNNISVCTEEGVWVKSTLTCTVKAAIGNVSVFNQTCVKWRRSTRETNLKVVYLFHVQGRRWHQKAFFHEAMFNFTAEKETPELCLDLKAGSNYTVNITVLSPEPSRPVTVTINTVEEEGFHSVSVFNDTCLKWKRHSGRIGVKETYLFHIQEQQGYLVKSSHEMMINFTTEEENPEVCLPLHLGVNYTVSITEASTKLVLQIPIVLPATEEELLSNVSVFNETCVKWQRKGARAGTKETYTFHILGRRRYQKEFSREMILNFTTDEETPEVCLELNSDANYMVNITTASSKGTSALITIAIKTEVKEAFSNMVILNDTCLKWRQSLRRAGRKEIYSFHIQGRRWYQKEFFHEMAFNLTAYGQTPEVCLDLRPGTNYTVNISMAALDLSVLVFMTTPIIDPLFPEIEFVTVQGPAPALSLRKAEDRNGPISFYQVIVLPLALQSTFTCDSLAAVTFFNNATDAKGYVAAEFLAEDVADNMLISVGDRHYYGAFYNAPLKQGKDYCVVLRIISQWNKVRTQSCAVWAQIEDLSPTLQHMTLAGLGSVTAVCLILFLSFLAARSYLHSTVHIPPAALAKGVSYETTMDAAGGGIASSFLEIESVSLL